MPMHGPGLHQPQHQQGPHPHPSAHPPPISAQPAAPPHQQQQTAVNPPQTAPNQPSKFLLLTFIIFQKITCYRECK